MMAEELLSLKWNNHQTHFVDILSILREHETFVDVTIACGGKLYAAHKFVLSTCSDYFKQMFIKNPSKHPIIFMKDVSSRDVEALMDFMYNGEVNVPQSTLGSLIKTAESLQIKGLAVPDDPPIRREKEINKEKRYIDSNSSPPAKRLKQREIIYNDSSAPKRTPVPPKSKSPNKPVKVVDAVIDEDSNSLHSGTSDLSVEFKLNQKSRNENVDYLEKLSSNSLEDPLAGPSGVQKSKEELDIKQEDINPEEEDDGITWNQECDSRGEEDHGEISVNSDNSNLFADHLLAGNDGSSLSVSTDSAMRLLTQGVTPRRVARLLFGSDLGCPLCHKTFTFPESMIRHCQGHLPAAHKLHCEGCGKSFHRRDQFRYHQARCDVLLPVVPPPLPPMPRLPSP